MQVKPYNFIYADEVRHWTFDLTAVDVDKITQLVVKGEYGYFRTESGCLILLDKLRFLVPLVEEKREENESATPPEYQMDDLLYKKSREEDLEDDDGEPV